MSDNVFKGRKYITRGANNKLPLVLQNYLWDLIEKARKKTELDYLQVFELKPHKVNINDEGKHEVYIQKIKHFQEKPSYSTEAYLPLANPVIDKVYVIDSKEYCTMLLADEY